MRNKLMNFGINVATFTLNHQADGNLITFYSMRLPRRRVEDLHHDCLCPLAIC